MTTDLLYIRRALELASFGFGYVSSLPLVGWVVAKKNTIIHEDWFNGGNFIKSFSKSLDGFDLESSTIYFNLNPAEFIDDSNELLDVLTQHQVKCLVIPGDDTQNKLSLTSSLVMRSIESIQNEAQWLNRRFFTWKKAKRPYIILKWAETADGFIARKNFDSKWISSPHSRKLVHQWRSQEDAIMVGTNTCRYDNPQLNVRDWSGRNPIRIIIDRQLQLDKQLHVFDQTQFTICYNFIRSHKENNLEYIMTQADSHEQTMSFILQDLHHRQIQSLFVEGGAQVLNLLIEQGWWDEARIFQSQILFNEGIKAPSLKSAKLTRVEDVSGDYLLIYQKLNKK